MSDFFAELVEQALYFDGLDGRVVAGRAVWEHLTVSGPPPSDSAWRDGTEYLLELTLQGYFDAFFKSSSSRTYT